MGDERLSKQRLPRTEREQRIRDTNVLECPRRPVEPTELITGIQLTRDYVLIINGTMGAAELSPNGHILVEPHREDFIERDLRLGLGVVLSFFS